MFPHQEVLKRLALEHFKRNIQIALMNKATSFNLAMSKHVAVSIFLKKKLFYSMVICLFLCNTKCFFSHTPRHFGACIYVGVGPGVA